MKPSQLIESDTMCAEDFGQNGIPAEPRVTIRDVVKETTGRKWPMIYFVEKWAKPLKVNSTHRRALCLMFGDDDTKQWHGKRIDLYVMRGDFPQGKKIAVRIKGSPDINRTYTFQMQKFGSSMKDTYTLVPTGSKVVLGPGLVRFGKQAGHWGKPFSEFTTEQLGDLVKMADDFLAANPQTKGKEDLLANMQEIREEITARTAPPPPPEPEPEPEHEVPL